MEISADYINGFNRGYLIRKELPVLGKQLINGAKGNSQYLEGLKAGAKQYEKEMEIKLKLIKQEKIKVKEKKNRAIEL